MPSVTMIPALARWERPLADAGQSHVLRFAGELSEAQQASLAAQIEGIDLPGLAKLIKKYVLQPEAAASGRRIEPAPYFPLNHRSASRPWDREKYRSNGEAIISAGKLAAFVVAGGQGSRLGFEGPKGCFPAGAISNKPLFQIFAEQILRAGRKYGRRIPWYIMTSPLNHAATEAFFKTHRYFGLDAADVMFFQQGVMPSLDIKIGALLMTSKGEIATNPDGHGGSITALHKSGAIADMKRRGIEQISYFQVDNPHVRIVDPTFVGLHATASESSGEVSSKMLAKSSAAEKVGVFCLVDGRLDMIEYSDMPAELSGATNADGSLKFNAGNPAIHLLSVAFVERLVSDGAFELPYHRAEKKVPCIDPVTGAAVTPTSNNGVKLEKFVFDALPRAEKSLVLETDRVEEFAPIKNASGVDSVESSRVLQTLRATRWIEAAGGKVPRNAAGEPDCVIEISPLAAAGSEDLAEIARGLEIKPGAKVAI
jgi:UDP-N-acetylglucosamine/UDP-N-acetylgalactosamine diphosphorylase